MFIPLEIVDKMCAYMENDDLISMALVCKHWNPTCTRHLSAHLVMDTLDSFEDELWPYLDNFNGDERHYHVPPHPSHIKSVEIRLDLDEEAEMTTDEEFAPFFELLEHLDHVRRLNLYITMSTSQLGMLDAACQEICALLPNIKHLKLSCTLSIEVKVGDDGEWAFEMPDASFFERITSNYQLKTLTLEYDYPFDGTVLLKAQAATLVELDLPFHVLVDRTKGFRVKLFPHVKKLTMRSSEPMRGGRVLSFAASFPSVEYCATLR
jgi:hypothetical protein